jgi:hypothetical protein
MCKHCRKVGPHPSSAPDKNTTAMSRHLKVCRQYKQTQTDRSVEERAREDFWNQRCLMSRSQLAEQILRIVIVGDLSFNFAENPALHAFLKISYPNIQRPTRKMIALRLSDQANEAKVHLRDYFATHDGKVSLALDGWNSRNNKDFIGTVPNGWCIGISTLRNGKIRSPDTYSKYSHISLIL